MTGDPTHALSTAAIPRDRCGNTRLSALTGGERRLYRSILTSFRAGTALGRDELAELASRLDLELEPALARLAREDLVHADEHGSILVAYPFSGRPTAHRVFFDGHEVYAMCAIDALGIAPMLGEAIEICSRDPLTDEEINVQLEPDGQGSWRPREAVVVCGTAGGGDACSGCCPVLNFFASTTSAQRWLASRPDVRGTVFSMEDAIAAGRVVFGDVLKEG